MYRPNRDTVLVRTTIMMDEDLRKEARELGLNISSIAREAVDRAIWRAIAKNPPVGPSCNWSIMNRPEIDKEIRQIEKALRKRGPAERDKVGFG